MGFDISGFKQAFMQGLYSAANSVNSNNQIDKGTSEVQAASNTVSAFKSELDKISNPIGDNLSFSSKNEITVDDMLALIDDADTEKVRNYIVTKPVQTIKPAEVPAEVSQLAELVTDVDVDKLNAYLGVAFNSDAAERIAENVKLPLEDMKTGYCIGLAYEVENT